MFKKADGNTERAQVKQQADFAKRWYKQKNLIVGDKVLCYNLRRANRKGGKQTDPWDGPYKVVQVCEKGLYCFINASTKVTLKTKVNGCNLKPFFERIPEALLQTLSVMSSSPSPSFLHWRLQCSEQSATIWWTSGIQEKSGPSRKKLGPSKTPANLLPLKQLKVKELVFFVHRKHQSWLNASE